MKHRIALVRSLPRNPQYRCFLPLFASVLSTAWRSLGYDVVFLDQAVLGRAETIRRIGALNPGVIAISALSDSFMELEDCVRDCICRFPQAKIVVGGPHVSEVGEEIRALLADNVEICFGDGCSYDPVTSNRIPNGHHLPMLPDWAGINVLDYYPVIPIQTSVGCPSRCAYCSEADLFGRGRMVAIPEVIDHIERCVCQLKVHTFRFVDSTFSTLDHRFETFCQALTERRLGIHWGAYVRWEHLSHRRLEMAAASGCRSLFLGVETLNPALASLLGRRSDVADLKAVVGLARDLGIHVHCSLIFGLPFDSVDGIRLTCDGILSAAPNTALANPFKLGPASEYGRHPERYGITILNPRWKLNIHRCVTDISLYEDFRVNGFTVEDVFTLVTEFNRTIEANGPGFRNISDPAASVASDFQAYDYSNQQSFSSLARRR